MPNHVVNELIFNGLDTGETGQVIKSICNKDMEVDFGILLPIPINVWWGDAATEHTKIFKNTAIDWCRENWGTKWNAYDQRPMTRNDGDLIFTFSTAWTPPYPWLAAVFNSLQLDFDHNHFSEGEGRGHHGVFRWSEMGKLAGNPWEDVPADDELHAHLHMLRWGCNEEQMSE